MNTLQSTREDIRIAYLVALAVAIHVAETLMPSPLPGIKPGLANIVTVVVFCQFGWNTAAWVGLLRTVVGGLLIGTFLSPTFFLSFTGALSAVAALVAARALPGTGPIGYSVLASMAHMATQFSVAYWLLVPHSALLKLFPVLMTAAVAFGIVNGVLAEAVLRSLKTPALETESKA